MRRKTQIALKTNPVLTWEEITTRLAHHINKLHSASNSRGYCKEIRRWRNELNSLEVGPVRSERREREYDR